jgi:hypothetical protein
MDRFLEFMIGDIEGGSEVADEIAREMVQRKEVPPHFIELRQRLRTCRSAQEMHEVYRSFS